MKEELKKYLAELEEEANSRTSASIEELEKLKALDFEEFRAKTIEHLGDVHNKIGGLEVMMNEMAAALVDGQKKSIRDLAKMAGKKNKQTDEVLENIYTRIGQLDRITCILMDAA